MTEKQKTEVLEVVQLGIDGMFTAEEVIAKIEAIAGGHITRNSELG